MTIDVLRPLLSPSFVWLSSPSIIDYRPHLPNTRTSYTIPKLIKRNKCIHIFLYLYTIWAILHARVIVTIDSCHRTKSSGSRVSLKRNITICPPDIIQRIESYYSRDDTAAVKTVEFASTHQRESENTYIYFTFVDMSVFIMNIIQYNNIRFTG